MTQVALPSRPRTRTRPRRAPAEGPRSLDDVQHFVLEDATWDLYEMLLKDVGDRTIRLTYDNGRLEMRSPLPDHERPKKVIGRLIEALTEMRGVEVASFGSTTFRRRDKGKGFEPDECYYLKEEKRMRGRKRLNMTKDPSPELVVEIDITHRSVDREPIYAAFGVPEIWRWDGTKLECLELVKGAYRARTTSLVFPFLAPRDLTRFVRMRGRIGENALIRKFRAWVRANGWSK